MYVLSFEKLETENPKEVLKIIRSTKSKMGKLKRIMENPFYKPTKCPTELTMFKCERDFLKMAIQKYIFLTGEYKYSKIDKKRIDFNENLNDLVKVIYDYSQWGNISCEEPLEIDLTKLSKDDKGCVIESLKDLHIGEWRKSYNPDRYGVCVLDGEDWELTFEFNNGKKVKYEGCNAHPYNFMELLEILEDYERLTFVKNDG